MSVTSTTATRPRVGDRTATRVAAVAAALLAVSLFMTVGVMNVPHKPSDRELLTFWQDPANRTSGVLSGMFALVVAVTMAVVINHLRRLQLAARSPQWLGFARSMGGAVITLWLVTGAARASIGHLVDTMDEPLPGVDVLRYATALNYVMLGLSGMAVFGLCILAVSVVVLRTGVFGRWLGYVGTICSAIILAAVVAQYGALTSPLAILWALCLAVAIWRQPTTEVIED
ncbi:MAG: hypothetical protein ACR2FP_01645 [Nocardioidaceae bacterium]